MTLQEMKANKSFCEKQIEWAYQQIYYWSVTLDELNAEIKEARAEDKETDRRVRHELGISPSEKTYVSTYTAELLRRRSRIYSTIKTHKDTVAQMENSAKIWDKMIAEEEAKQTEEEITENTDTTTEETKEEGTMNTTATKINLENGTMTIGDEHFTYDGESWIEDKEEDGTVKFYIQSRNTGNVIVTADSIEEAKKLATAYENNHFDEAIILDENGELIEEQEETTMNTTTTIFPKLRAEIEAQTVTQKENIFFYIQNGYMPSWGEQHHNDPERGLKHYSTSTRWSQYKAGKISREKAVELAQKRALKEIESRREKRLARLDEAEKAPAITSGNVSVEWSKNRTWGANPTARFLNIGQGETTGYASGCGYDKESAAIAEAFNKSPSALRVLYELGEAALNRGDSPKSATAAGGYHWGGCIGYGAGYDVLPYWEGGVGSSCFWRILEKAGYTVRNAGSGKMFDCYTINKEA